MAKFQKGNTFWKHRKSHGTNTYWTEDKIKEVLQDLEDYLSVETHISIAGFRGHYGISDEQLRVLREKSSDFAHAYDMAKKLMGQRLAEGTNKNAHSRAFDRYASMYDSELHQHEKEAAKETNALNEQKFADAMKYLKDIQSPDLRIDNTNKPKE